MRPYLSFSRQQVRSIFIRYGATTCAILAAIIIFPLTPLRNSSPFPALAVLLACAWFGGIGPAVFAPVLLVIAANLVGRGPQSLSDIPRQQLLDIGAVTLLTAAVGWSGQLRRRAYSRTLEALREADRRKDEFLATLAHELRNPLAPICNSLALMKAPGVDAETVAWARDVMGRQIHQLQRLVDDLLDVSRVMRGKIELRHEYADLCSIVSQAVEAARPQFEGSEHDLQVSVPDEPLTIDADPVRLAQVIGNLLTNAAKYTPARGHISLTLARQGTEAVLTVRDDGIGIAPDLLPDIFGLFIQADHRENRAQGGLGIGLTLVKSLVELHKGSVTAVSAGLGQGSEFVVRLPIAAVSAVQPDPASGGSIAGGVPLRRVLVVDDNRDAAASLSRLLTLDGHDVRVAHDGPGALEMARDYRPDLIFLDIGMPEMDGYEVARRLRQQPEMDNTPLAALTGWGQPTDRQRSAEAGFDHHLVKPLDLTALQKLLTDPRRSA